MMKVKGILTASLIIFFISACSDKTLIVMDEEFNLLGPSLHMVRFRALLKGRPSEMLIIDEEMPLENQLELFAESESYDRYLFFPPFWHRQDFVHNLIPSDQCYWLMGNPEVNGNSIISDWNLLDAKQWDRVVKSLEGGDIILIYESDELSIRRKDELSRNLIERGLHVDFQEVNSQTWSDRVDGIDMESFSDIVVITPHLFTQMFSDLAKWDKPIGGELIDSPGAIREWSFTLSEPWTFMVYEAIVLDQESREGPLGIAPILDVNP